VNKIVKAQRTAAAEALRAFEQASAERRRTKILAYPDGCNPVDVTEHVVSLLDMITMSMDWGSDFWTDTDLPSFIELCKLLNFDEVPELHVTAVKEPPQ
jgi:hypothetical protein